MFHLSEEQREGSVERLKEAVFNEHDHEELDDMLIRPIGHREPGDPLDINDELFSMQEQSAFNLFKKRTKKSRKYKEWKVDMLLDDDAKQMAYLQKQIQRMRKKEEVPVNIKMIQKNKTDHDVFRQTHMGGSSMNVGQGMNIRNRVKQQY